MRERTTEARRENGTVTAVQSYTNSVSNLLRVPTSGARALRALEALGLLLEEEAAEEIRVINVTTVCAYPLALPVALLLCEVRPGLFLPAAEGHERRCPQVLRPVGCVDELVL